MILRAGELGQMCNGRWPQILAASGVPEKLLSGKSQPCPWCGGKDRFRFTDHEGDGWFFCNQCSRGKGVEFLMKYLRIGYSEARKMAAENIGAPPARKRYRSNGCPDFMREARPIRRSDPAARYLASRGLNSCSTCLYHHPGIFDGATKRYFHALLGVIQGPDGSKMGYHLTLLEKRQQNSWAKATIDNPKRQRKICSTVSGGAVRLADPLDGAICVAEGIETALAVMALFNRPCWSLMNTACMKGFQVPEEITEVCIMADNDANFRGQQAAYTLASRLAAKGLEVSVNVPPGVGHDYLDVLNAKNKTHRR